MDIQQPLGGRALGLHRDKEQEGKANSAYKYDFAGTVQFLSLIHISSLLKILAELGHGDEIVFSDAHFPGHTFNPTVLRADGVGADALLAAVIPLFELDAYATPVIMMAPVPGDSLDPAVEAKYRKACLLYTSRCV